MTEKQASYREPAKQNFIKRIAGYKLTIARMHWLF